MLKLVIWSFTKNKTGYQKAIPALGFEGEYGETSSQPWYTFLDAHSLPTGHFFKVTDSSTPTWGFNQNHIFRISYTHFPPSALSFLKWCNSQWLAVAILNVCLTSHIAEVAQERSPPRSLFFTGDSPETLSTVHNDLCWWRVIGINHSWGNPAEKAKHTNENIVRNEKKSVRFEKISYLFTNPFPPGNNYRMHFPLFLQLNFTMRLSLKHWNDQILCIPFPGVSHAIFHGLAPAAGWNGADCPGHTAGCVWEVHLEVAAQGHDLSLQGKPPNRKSHTNCYTRANKTFQLCEATKVRRFVYQSLVWLIWSH